MTNYIEHLQENECYGCRACEHICPQKAIFMKPNSEGFLYPELDESKCVKCGLCSKICPHDNTQKNVNQPIKVFAGQYKESETLMRSSSGGMFSAVADYVLEQNGYVAGCLFDKNFIAVHAVTNDKSIADKMCGSKYVQSDTKDTYPQIESLLKNRQIVLFTGTPCQVDGLKRYLRKDYDNLITIDLICHGVPSPGILSSYLDAVRAKYGEVTSLTFRNKKRNGWCSQGSIGYAKKIKTISPFNNSYYNFYYLQNSISRKCCYECKYSTSVRTGDISIGDFWGVEEFIPNLNSKNGISAVLANTEKGLNLLNTIKARLILIETRLENVAKNNGNLTKPCNMPASRHGIYERIKKEGYEAVAKKECHYQYIKPFIRKHIPKSLKRLLKKVKSGGK